MAGKRPRHSHIQRTTSMSQLGNPASLYQSFNGELGMPIRGRSCPPQQELGHVSMEPCPEAPKMALLQPSDMDDEHICSMVIDSGNGERIFDWAYSNRVTMFNGRFVMDRSRPANFLDMCYLCSKMLGHGRDVYIYRGDRAFCSAECRQLQMLADERREKSVLTGAPDGPVAVVQVSDASNASHVETVVAA